MVGNLAPVLFGHQELCYGGVHQRPRADHDVDSLTFAVSNPSFADVDAVFHSDATSYPDFCLHTCSIGTHSDPYPYLDFYGDACCLYYIAKRSCGGGVCLVDAGVVEWSYRLHDGRLPPESWYGSRACSGTGWFTCGARARCQV